MLLQAFDSSTFVTVQQKILLCGILPFVLHSFQN